MKATFLELQNYYATKRQLTAASDFQSHQLTQLKQELNVLRDMIVGHKQWAFCGRKLQFTTVPAYSTGTISGTAGEHIVTGSSTSWPASVNGVLLRGQFLKVGNHLYKIARRTSTTKLVLESGLRETVSAGSTYSIYFMEYPLRWDVGWIRRVIRDTTPISSRPESITSPDGDTGDPIEAFVAGQMDANFASFTGTLTDASDEVTSISGITVADEHIGMALMKQSDPDIYYVIDIDTSVGKLILDRKYQGTTGSTTILLNPRGTPLLGLKEFADARRLITVQYTKRFSEMVDDNDLTGLPDDTPMFKGIDVITTKWETVGDGNINEAIFQDRAFKESLRVLVGSGTQMPLKLFLPHDYNVRRSHLDFVRRKEMGLE